MKCKVLLFGLILSVLGLTVHAKTFFCYWATWANYRQGNGKFTVYDIDSNLCTHIIYTYFGITEEGRIKIIDPYVGLSDNWGLGFIEKFNHLKRLNPNLKTLASVGGWNEGSYTFSQVAKTAKGRQTFAQEAVDFCQKYGFDGLDLDWQYPGQRDGDPLHDRANFVRLVRELAQKLHQNGLMLTAAVEAVESVAQNSYNIPEISKDLDYINLMTFDFNGHWDEITGHNSPLYPSYTDLAPTPRERNIEASINYWVLQGAPRQKLVLGIPLYGRTFTLSNSSNNIVGAATSGSGQSGPYSEEPGYLGYNEFCEMQLSQPWYKEWDNKRQVPYAVWENQWIGYDNTESIALKAWYARNQQLGGVMVKSIETDDFGNICGAGRYPLLNQIKYTFLDGVDPPELPPTQPPVITDQPPTSPPGTLICYWGTWANYRPGNGQFTVNDIDPNLCTHVIYTYFGITKDGRIRIRDPYLDLSWGLGFIKKLNSLKRLNPNLRTLASVGGWNEGSYKFSQVAKESKSRKKFAEEAVEFCRKHGFDGLDLDWRYPGQRGGNPVKDKANFVLLVKELAKKLHKNGLLFTAALASLEYSARISYNIPKISKYLDFINLMTYDFNGAWDSTTGHNAPLFPGHLDHTSDKEQRNVEASVNYWISQGAPREKLVLGIPIYGRTFTLSNSSNNGIGAAASGPGKAGPYTDEAGLLGYNEYCEIEKSQSWKKRWDEWQSVPYAYRGNQWIGYENIVSVNLKATYARKQQLAGVMVWSIETDDFRNICGDGRNPILTIIKQIIMDGEQSTEVPTDPPATDPPATDPPATDPPATDPPATDPPATDPPATDPPATDPPATDPPATDPPATDPPATDPPATDPPATGPPATDPPATGPPATDPPATDPPATDPPPIDPPATDPPATDPPATDPPATDPPATDPPATDPSATDPPATDPPPIDPPATDPPATDPPATDPPATDPPATDPPATDPPATDPPATDPPATDPPATDPPATDPPVTDPPVTDPPATDPPATDPPATDPPATDPPATGPPATDPPATGPPATDPPATDPPATDPPATDPPATDPPATDPPATDPPATDPPATDPPATDPPATDPPATDPPATDPPATDPPATDPPATDPPATDPPATDPPATDPPATDPPATDPPATDPPATDPPATDPPATDPPATDPPATDPSATDPPATDPPATEPPGDIRCTVDGTFRDPNDCAAFYICLNGVRYVFRCEEGLVFDPVIGGCNWPSQVQCY